jgi:antitoxin (DNA-binding transcriptional repressor) of toxin-antitoxin stability system
MIISSTDFKARCSALIEHVIHTNEPLLVTRHGEVVVRLERATPAGGSLAWSALRGQGTLSGRPGDSVLEDGDLDALT